MGIMMNMGLGAGAGGYQGPVYGSDGPAAVPATAGYADTAPGRAMTFGPGGVSGGTNSTVHALAFGVFCFAALVFMAWALPR